MEQDMPMGEGEGGEERIQICGLPFHQGPTGASIPPQLSDEGEPGALGLVG